ncbi:CopD family protein [Altererythrobacter lutimaris]|uniref:Protoporphyrinogen IX oxidase n=1 Tax=Altererythrobacter lutimaris TaxID=2743979 RepID=A0A850HBE9_9SPHN|nr:CopD family protein [Altererythrobacter lutimaris]NVE95403.1 CopD family protein [Altererythrobacter lutimaris]
MQDVIAVTYLWFKAAHIIFMVFWLAGLFMLPRQLIYVHAASAGSDEQALWIKRMGLLRKIILTPSMIIVWIAGLLMAYQIGLFSGGAGLGWLHAKLLLVVLLTGFHGFLVAQVKKNARGERPLSEKQLRLFGEIPGLLLVLIVILAIVKPF